MYGDFAYNVGVGNFRGDNWTQVKPEGFPCLITVIKHRDWYDHKTTAT